MLIYILLFIIAVILIVTLWVEFHEVVSIVKVLNPEGKKGKALLVYQKGLRDFQPKVTLAFANGLVSNDWKVEITTASKHAPTNISGYELLVFIWPTYWFNPSLSLKRYIRRIGDLKSKNTVLVCTAAGAPRNSCKKMKAFLKVANANIVKNLTLFTLRPNEDNRDPIEIATQAGKEMLLP